MTALSDDAPLDAESAGTCAYCGALLDRDAMAAHLGDCPERQGRIGNARGRRRPLLHLVARDHYGGNYWLHLEMDGNERLDALDEYLRAIWLECCGHLSKFTKGDRRRGKDVSSRGRARDVLGRGGELLHIYDFGSSTETRIEVIDEHRGPATTERPIVLMARNAPPVFPCTECGEPASTLCLECMYEEGRDGALCGAHERTHPHEEYGAPIPISNSPRLGVCGYTGPAEPPY